MTPTEFVAGLADVMNVPHTEIATVDRALAKQGMRQIARGRARPDVTLREGLQILCAWAGAKKLTDAPEEVKRLEHYHPNAIPEDEYEGNKRSAKLFGSDFGKEESDLYGKDFITVVSEVAQWLGAGELPPDLIRVSIQQGGEPKISYDWQFQTKRLKFDWYGKLDFPNQNKAPAKPVRITASISGTVLKWIFDVTEGAKV